MKGLLDVDGPLMDVLRKFSDIVIYNVLFIVFSIPVITMGASLTALCKGVQRVAEDDEDVVVSTWKDFWETFKKNFVVSTKTWLIVLVCGAYLYALQHAVMSMTGDGDSLGLGSAYMITYYVCAFILIFGYMNLFPSRARWQDLTLWGGITRAFQISIISLPWTSTGIGLTSAFIYITLIFNLNVLRFGLFLWIVCGFGICAYIYSFFFLKGAKKFEESLEAKERGEETEGSSIGGSIFVDTFSMVGEAQKEAAEKRKAEAAKEEKDEDNK